MKHLERALDGQNFWLKYILTLFVALILGQGIGSIPLLVVSFFNPNQPSDFVKPENRLDFAAYGINPMLGLVLVVIPFIVMLVLTFVMARAIHNRNPKDIINGGSEIRWNRIIWGFVVWFVLAFAMLVIAIGLNSENFEFSFNLSSLLPLIIVSVLFIPFQAASEEVLVRGYLAQGVAGWTKRPWLVVLLPSIFFGLLHSFNPEIEKYGFWLMMPQYIIIGVSYAVITVLDDGLELAIGLHAANNVFVSIFVTTEASAIQTPALFFQKNINVVHEFWSVIISSVVLVTVLAFLFKWDFSVLWSKIQAPEIDNEQEMEREATVLE